MAVTQEKIQEIVERIVEVVDPYRIYLFGSRARGDARADSDVDLLVIADMEGSRHKRSLSIHRLFPGRDFGMDVFVFRPEEFERQKNVVNTLSSIVFKEGKILYERERDSSIELVPERR